MNTLVFGDIEVSENDFYGSKGTIKLNLVDV